MTFLLIIALEFQYSLSYAIEKHKAMTATLCDGQLSKSFENYNCRSEKCKELHF